MNKKIVLLFVACVLFMAAFAHPTARRSNWKQPVRRNHLEDEKLFESPKRMPMFNFHPGLEHKKNMKSKNKTEYNSHITNLRPGVVTEKTIHYGEAFTVDVADGNALAVQIVRSSNMYSIEDGHYPHLTLCRRNGAACVTDTNNRSLSFEVEAADRMTQIKKSRGTYFFTLHTTDSKITDVVVDIYVCVGKDASLATCRTPMTINCTHGQPSDVIDACICDDGYTGKTCSVVTEPAPEIFEFDSIAQGIKHFIYFVVFIFYVVIFIMFCLSLLACCVCLRACCIRRRTQRGRVVNQNQPCMVRPRPIIPPPAYAYHPISVAPPPPPPPMPQPRPQPQQQPRFNPYEGIELSTMPPRNPNPVYVMPPLAPVKQVPVYVQPRAPKN